MTWQGVKLNVIVDANDNLAYAKMLVATQRGVKKIDPAVLKIAFDHWETKLTECGIARDVARQRLGINKYMEHKMCMQVSAIMCVCVIACARR